MKFFSSFLYIAFCIYFLWCHPYGFLLCPFIIVYSVILIYRPDAWLFFVPLAIPSIDTVQQSGWFFFTVSDLVMACTLAVLSLRCPNTNFFPKNKSAQIAVMALMVTFIVSALHGLLPLSPLDQNAFATYHTSFNSIRIFKGFLWALLLQRFLNAQTQGGSGLKLFLSGVMCGLCIVICYSLWERYIFSGIFNMDQDFRINSVFSSMHTGGGPIEAYLIMTIPLIFSWAFLIKNKIGFFVSFILLIGASYVMVVTYSRAGYVTLLFALTIWLLFSGQQLFKLRFVHTLGIFIAIITAIALMGVLLSESSFLQKRFFNLSNGYKARKAHWEGVVSIMNPGLQTQLTGMGLGVFPLIYRNKNKIGRDAGISEYIKRKNNLFVRLFAGKDFYFDQRIKRSDFYPLVLSFDLKSSKPHWEGNILLCEKNMLHSFNCFDQKIVYEDLRNNWVHFEISIKEISEFTKTKRPVFLSFSNHVLGSYIDIDNVSFTDARGNTLVANGDFSNVNNHWFFVSDNHLAWHIDSLFLELFFEQGWLGLIIFIFAFIVAVGDVFKKVKSKSFLWSGFLASLLGFIVIGFSVASFEFPKITCLFFLQFFLLLKLNTRGQFLPDNPDTKAT